MNNNNGKAWKILGPLIAGLLLSASGLIYASVNQRINRLERLLDEIVPVLYRIESKLDSRTAK